MGLSVQCDTLFQKCPMLFVEMALIIKFRTKLVKVAWTKSRSRNAQDVVGHIFKDILIVERMFNIRFSGEGCEPPPQNSNHTVHYFVILKHGKAIIVVSPSLHH